MHIAIFYLLIYTGGSRVKQSVKCVTEQANVLSVISSRLGSPCFQGFRQMCEQHPMNEKLMDITLAHKSAAEQAH